MARAVSLRELDSHLSDASRLVQDAFESADDEPTLNFRELAGHLRAALGLLGEGDESVRETLDSITRRGKIW